MDNQQRELRPIMVAANKIKDVNNRKYDIKSAKTLPSEITLESISTPSKNGITVLFTKNSL